MNLLECMVLCAGRGERLRPLTEVCPKPMLPVLGVTLADRALAACELLSPSRRLANAHHLPEQIMAWGEARILDHVQVEPVLLDSGGALARAWCERELHGEHLLVHNGDILHDIDLREPWARHVRNRNDLTLVVVDRPAINTVACQADRFVGVRGHKDCPEAFPEGVRMRTFTGIAFYRTAILEGWPNEPWSVKDLWHRADRAGIWEAPEGCVWEDCGTPEDLVRATRDEMARRGRDRWVDPTAQVHAEAEVGPGCVAEFGTRVQRGAVLEDAILLPGAEAGPGERLTHLLRNPGGDAPW